MRLFIVSIIMVLWGISFCFAQTTTSSQIIAWGRAGATDIEEVENGCMANLQHNFIDGIGPS